MRNASVMGLLMMLASMPAAAAPAPKEEDLQASGAKRLATEQIRALHSGRTVYHVNLVSGFRVAIWYSADGTRSFRSGGRQYSGEWGARDDKRCEETTAGPIVCMSFYQRGDDVSVCDPREAPECRWRIERSVEGDAEGLGKRP
jgi:hypothetical protein